MYRRNAASGDRGVEGLGLTENGDLRVGMTDLAVTRASISGYATRGKRNQPLPSLRIFRPVLHDQLRHAAKFAGVIRDQRQPEA